MRYSLVLILLGALFIPLCGAVAAGEAVKSEDTNFYEVMMRIMTGSRAHLEEQQGMMKMLIDHIAEDGLFYAPAGPARPWHETVGHKSETITDEDFANVYGNSRLLLAFMAWMQYDPDGPWRQKAQGIANALSRIAVKKIDYAYYPDNRVGEAFSYPKGGWRHTEEPKVEKMGAEGSMFMYYCGPIRALTRWYRFTGDQQALDTASRLVRFVTQKHFWGIEPEPHDMATADRVYISPTRIRW